MDPNSFTPNDDDIVDQLLRNLDIQDAETDTETDSETDTELDDSRVLSEIMGTGTEDNGQADKLTIDNVEYVEVAKLARKGRSKNRSSIWKIGVELKKVDDKSKWWLCLACKEKKKFSVFSASATTGAFRHLKKSHKIVEKDGRLVRMQSSQRPDSEPPTFGTVDPHLCRKELVDNLRLLFLKWLVCCHIALSMAENPFFLALIAFINHAVLDFLPKSSDTLRKWVIAEYDRQKEIKKKMMLHSRSRIAISFDTWTAPFAKKHIISVIAHFVDQNWERRHLQLSLSRLYGGHSGENVAAHVVPILRDWEIDGRIGHFVTDNEPSNGTTIDHILAAIDPTYKKADRSRRWIRCLAHTLNLVSQAFLLGENPEKFEARVVGAELVNDLDELEMLWRDRGVVGKLKNIVRYIRKSPKQRGEFERIKVTECGDIEWLAAEDVENERQLEVRGQYVSFILSANDFSSFSLTTRLAGTQR